MTEEEAKTKWCPCVRFQVGTGSTFNRGHLDPMETFGEDLCVPRCIASGCMAWRTLPSANLAATKGFAELGMKINAIKALRDAYPAHQAPGLKEAKDIVEASAWPTVGGYCGLAGVPA